MPIFDGNSANLAELWDGNSKVVEVWAGNDLVWSSGPTGDAAFWLDFNEQANMFRNKGTSAATIPVMESAGAVFFEKDHAIFGTNGRVFAEPNSTWAEGYTLSMWTRDTPANSGWRTIMHRAAASGTLTNEAYIVHNTTATTTTTVSGLRLGGAVREFSSSYSLPVGVDWFHTVVSWERVSATAFTCRFYINGVLRGSYTATGYPSNVQFSTENLYIGGNRDAGEWSGRMDDLIMWRRALTDAEITQVYDMGRSSVPQITTSSINEMKIGAPFSQQIVADFPVISWSATGLPAGISINSSTGVLSGTPTTVSSGALTVTANGNGITDQSTFSWSVISGLISIYVPFNSNGDIDYYFPIRGFDARTASNSPRNAAFTFDGMLAAGDNNVVTYWQALHGDEVDSEQVSWSMTMGNAMNTIARPTEIILSSDANLQYQLLVQIGSASISVVSRTTGAITTLRSPYSRTIGNGSTVSVQRNGLNISVYHNNVLLFTYAGTSSNAASWFRMAGRAYTGITMYSTSGQWSSRVSDFTVSELV